MSLKVLLFALFVGLCAAKDFFFVPQASSYLRMLCRSKLKGSHNSLICPKRRLPETPEPSAAPPLPPLPPPFYPPMMGAPPVDNKVFVVPYQDQNHLQRPFVNFLLIPEEVLQPTAPLDTLEEEEEREVFVHHHHHHHPRDKKKKRRRKTKESVGWRESSPEMDFHGSQL